MAGEELNAKQAELLQRVKAKFKVLTQNPDAEIMEMVINQIKNLASLDFMPAEKVDLIAVFNDIIYKPQTKFIIPPVSYLDTKQAYWSERKSSLIARYGMGETKDGVLADGLMASINKGASLFDPVLCELIISWFNICGGRVFNPFCGEASIGFISGALGCEFTGIDIRQEQVDINRGIIEKAGIEPKPRYFCGDSKNLDSILTANGEDGKFDLIFSSPPYYDLEIYSDNKADLSTKGTYEEFIADYKIIFEQAIDRLKYNRFLVVKVGEIRDEEGRYRNFVGDNIRIFTELGLNYYNEIILLNQFGTAPMRFNQNFKTRKIVKIHQNILVFFLGDMKKIPEIFKEINIIKDLQKCEEQVGLWK